MKKLTTILLLAAAQIFAAGAIAAGTISTKIISPKGATNLVVFEGDTITLEAKAEFESHGSYGIFNWYASQDGKKWISEYDWYHGKGIEGIDLRSRYDMSTDYSRKSTICDTLEISGLKETMKFKYELHGQGQ